MKKLLIILAVCIIVAPAMAARPATTTVGPYTVETRLSPLGGELSVDGKISAGNACEQMLVDISLAEAKSGQSTSMKSTIERYRGRMAERFSASVAKSSIGATFDDWFIKDITIQCVNKGVATRYSNNP